MIVLVLGGTRSGKSEVAERRAAELGGPDRPVTYLATGAVTDDDFAARVEAHRRRRDPSWTTVECGSDLAEALRSCRGVALVDSLGTWIVGLDDDPGPRIPDLCAALREGPGDAVVVSEEVGMSVHPPTEAGRRFVDALGSVNHAVASCADEVLLVVAGRTLRLP